MNAETNTQRDELADEIAGHPIGHGYYSTSVGIDEAREIADDILAAGYRKPRTITTVEELDALPFESVITDGYNTPYVCEKHRVDGSGNEWQMAGTNYLQESWAVLEHGDVTVWFTPEAAE